MKAVLQDRAKLARKVPSLIWNLSRFWNFQPRYLKNLGHGCFSSTPARSFSSSIDAVTTFIVEPGASDPWNAVLKPREEFAAARISPVDGRSSTTDARGFFATCSSAAACSDGSSVVGT